MATYGQLATPVAWRAGAWRPLIRFRGSRGTVAIAGATTNRGSPRGIARARPGHAGEARDILTWLHSLSPDTYVNVMEQYRPTHKVGTGEQRTRSGFTKYEDIDRPVEISEVNEVKQFARDIGLMRLEEMELINRPITEM